MLLTGCDSSGDDDNDDTVVIGTWTREETREENVSALSITRSELAFFSLNEARSCYTIKEPFPVVGIEQREDGLYTVRVSSDEADDFVFEVDGDELIRYEGDGQVRYERSDVDVASLEECS